jgi:hypothetical protein
MTQAVWWIISRGKITFRLGINPKDKPPNFEMSQQLCNVGEPFPHRIQHAADVFAVVRQASLAS